MCIRDSPTNDQSTKMFTEGMSVMMFNSSGGITGNTATIGDKFEMVVAPPLKDEVQSMPTGGCGFGIMTASKNPDAAWDFVKWYIQDEKGGLALSLIHISPSEAGSAGPARRERRG